MSGLESPHTQRTLSDIPAGGTVYDRRDTSSYISSGHLTARHVYVPVQRVRNVPWPMAAGPGAPRTATQQQQQPPSSHREPALIGSNTQQRRHQSFSLGVLCKLRDAPETSGSATSALHPSPVQRRRHDRGVPSLPSQAGNGHAVRECLIQMSN